MPIYAEPNSPNAAILKKQIGHTYVFRRRYGAQERMSWYYPYNPRTVGQQANRALWATAHSNWGGFSQAVKNYYNILAEGKNFSGQNKYIKFYMDANKL